MVVSFNSLGTTQFNCSNLYMCYLESLFLSLLLLLLFSLLSHLCMVFTIIYLKQTMFIGYILLQLFCIYNFVRHVFLLRPRNMFCTLTLALSVVCVQCPIRLFFCSSLISCFPGMLLRYCLSDFTKVRVAHIITGIAFAFIFHMRWISILTSLYVTILSVPFLFAFLSPGLATAINMLMAWTDRRKGRQAADMKNLVVVFPTLRNT